MELKAHDIVEIIDIDNVNRLLFDIPDWVKNSLINAPYVVVRREHFNGKNIPIGIRGAQRGQRFGTWLPIEMCKRVIKPYSLNDPNKWCSLLPFSFYNDLKNIASIFKVYPQKWGIGGSIGFSLASESPYYNNSSDIDILLYPEKMFSKDYAKSLIQLFAESVTHRCDIQVQTTIGSFNLNDYAQNEKVLLKTEMGIHLMHLPDIW